MHHDMDNRRPDGLEAALNKGARMRSFLKRKKLVAGISGAGVLVLAGAAIAYFTASGSGTGSATVGTSTAMTVHGTSGSTLYPGSTSTVSFTVDNPSSGNQQLGTVHLASVKACTGSGSSWNGSACSNSGTEQTTCESVENGATDGNTANFWMADVAANQDISSGNGQSVNATGTLKMNDLNSSQDACKNANLTLNFTS
jgi:hypothetical protein